MARFPQLVGSRGSQKWIQILVNENVELLNTNIKRNLNLRQNEDIQWLSPLKTDEYAEYRDQAFLDLLGIKLKEIPLSNFWPKGGPQWDALGKSSLGKVFLIEAKSHIQELISSSKAKDQKSIERINKSLQETKQFLNSKVETDWTSGFYQYTNRLSHVYLLRRNRLPAHLFFLYFLNDTEMKGPTTIDEWRGAIKLLHSYLGIGRHKLREFVTDIFIDVKLFE
jgi:hypothetical protein